MMIFFGGTRSRQSGWQIVRYVRYAGEPIQDESYHRLFDKNVCNRCLDEHEIYVED